MSMISSRPDVCVCDLTATFDVSGPTISHHLRVLRELRRHGYTKDGYTTSGYTKPEATPSRSPRIPGATDLIDSLRGGT